jgi:hypothetical protein
MFFVFTLPARSTHRKLSLFASEKQYISVSFSFGSTCLLKISAWWVTNFQIIETVVGFPRDLAVVFVVVMTFSFSFFFCKLLLLLLLFFVLVVLVVLVDLDVFASAFTSLDDDVFLFPIVLNEEGFLRTHTKHTKGGRVLLLSGESGRVFVLKRKESFPRALLRVCMCDMPGQKRDIMKRKMSVFVCLSFSL